MKRIRDGIRVAVISATLFCIFISLVVFGFARPLMLIFVPAHETEIISIGIQYLRILLRDRLFIPVVRFLSGN